MKRVLMGYTAIAWLAVASYVAGRSLEALIGIILPHIHLVIR